MAAFARGRLSSRHSGSSRLRGRIAPGPPSLLLSRSPPSSRVVHRQLGVVIGRLDRSVGSDRVSGRRSSTGQAHALRLRLFPASRLRTLRMRQCPLRRGSAGCGGSWLAWRASRRPCFPPPAWRRCRELGTRRQRLLGRLGRRASIVATPHGPYGLGDVDTLLLEICEQILDVARSVRVVGAVVSSGHGKKRASAMSHPAAGG
mgnify:CR=1 FL=1